MRHLLNAIRSIAENSYENGWRAGYEAATLRAGNLPEAAKNPPVAMLHQMRAGREENANATVTAIVEEAI